MSKTSLAAWRLAEAAVTRLCHDLSGSLGAVMNALELILPEGGASDPEAMRLAADATHEAAARLRLARMIWACDRPMRASELSQLTEGLPGRNRLDIDIDLQPGPEPNAASPDARLTPASARLLLATLSMAAESMRGSGRITLSGRAGREAVVVIEGPRAAWPPDLPGIIADPLAPWDEPDPTELMPRLAALLAVTANARLSLLLSTGTSPLPPPLLIQFAAP